MEQQSLVVDDFGVFVGKKSERVVLRKDKEVIKEVPFFNLKEILISGSGVSFSSDVIRKCAKAGIQIDFVSWQGDHLAKLSSAAMTGTIKTRREQLSAYNDKRGIELAVAFARGKIENQIVLLKYLAKYRKSKDTELYHEIYEGIEEIEAIKEELQQVDGVWVDEVRDFILSVEGRAASKYWQVIKKVLPAELKFTGRKTQGAEDLVNSLLNYGYGILYSRVSSAILRAGLDLFAGFLHADRAGRPSLTLDLVEEFRQAVVDRRILGLLNRGMEFTVEDGRIEKEDRRRLADKILEGLKSKERYRGEKCRLEVILQRQARRIASFVKGKRAYEPFVSNW